MQLQGHQIIKKSGSRLPIRSNNEHKFGNNMIYYTD